jgi:hypothetical protein
MIQQEHFSPGTDVNFQFEVDGQELTYAGRVHDRDDRTLSIEINEEGIEERPLSRGMTGVLWGRHEKGKVSLPIRIENSDALPILHIREHNSRSYFRVNGFIRLKHRKIVGGEYIRMREQFLSRTVPKAETVERDLVLDERIIHSHEADLIGQEPARVNLSGSGMRFHARDDLEVGDLLEMTILLPFSPYSVIRTIALVIRVERSPRRKSSFERNLTMVAVKFVVIREEDRDAIIRCALAWERQMLRRMQIVH